MKRIITIFGALTLICIMMMSLSMSGKILSKMMSDEHKIQPEIFQTNSYSEQRLEKPISLDMINTESLTNSLLERYVRDYYEIIPYSAEMDRRKNASHRPGQYFSVEVFSATEIFKTWQKSVASEMLEMSNRGILRLADIEKIEKKNDYYSIIVRLTTFDKPNDIQATPKIERKNVFIRAEYHGRLWNESELLQNGEDPTLIFDFRVFDVKEISH